MQKDASTQEERLGALGALGQDAHALVGKWVGHALYVGLAQGAAGSVALQADQIKGAEGLEDLLQVRLLRMVSLRSASMQHRQLRHCQGLLESRCEHVGASEHLVPAHQSSMHAQPREWARLDVGVQVGDVELARARAGGGHRVELHHRRALRLRCLPGQILLRLVPYSKQCQPRNVVTSATCCAEEYLCRLWPAAQR